MAERTLNPSRQAIEPRGVEANQSERKSLVETRQSPNARGVIDYNEKVERTVVIPSWGATAGNLTFYDVFPRPPIDQPITSGVSQTGQPLQPIYGDDDAFRIAADVFSKFYGAAPTETAQSPVVVGDAAFATQGGSNVGLILILGLIGVAGYFLYKKYRGN